MASVLHPTERDYRLYGDEAIWFTEPVTFSTVERSATITATGTIATVGQRDLLRATAINATATITTVGRRDVLRAAAISATSLITTSSHRDVQRSASITGTGSITTAATFYSTIERQATIDATGTISVSGAREAVTHERAAALTATTSIQSSAIHWTTFQRSALITGTGTITTTGQRALHRTTAITAIGVITATPGLIDHVRTVAITGTTSITVAGIAFAPRIPVGRLEGSAGVIADEGIGRASQTYESSSGVLALTE